MLHKLLLVAVLLALASGSATALMPGTLFSQADRDGDGLVSWPEARVAFPRLDRVHFDRCDRNSDGLLDRREYLCLRQVYEMHYQRR